ncbi:MAG: putative zinc-binding metallopeptidase [Maribacter sp.]
MRNLKNWRLLLVLFLALATFQSCYKEDGYFEDDFVDNQSFQDEEEEDFDNGNSNTDSNDTSDSNGSDNSDSGASGDEGEITRYLVNGDKIVKEKDYEVAGKALEFQNDVAKHQEIWELTKRIIPTNYLAKMSHFMIFVGEDNGTAGYVYETEANLSKWEMGIAIDFAYEGGGLNADGELAHTIIHEFGHILTLDNTQVDSSVSENNCQNYFPGEGCAKKEAYINKLQARYWADIQDEHSNIGENENELDSFYVKYQDRFVTDYASTNPAEDIAEVFATFVIRNGGVNGNTISEQKIQLMYDHPELIGLRNFIKGNTASAKGKRALPIASSWKKVNTLGNSKRTGCLKHSR